MSSPLISPLANAKYDLSCKEDADDRDNEIWKCNFAVPQSFLNYSESLCLKSVLTIREIDWCEPFGDEKNAQIFQQVFTSSTQLQKKKNVVERTTTAKHCEMYENEKRSYKTCKNPVFIVKFEQILFAFRVAKVRLWPSVYAVVRQT